MNGNRFLNGRLVMKLVSIGVAATATLLAGCSVTVPSQGGLLTTPQWEPSPAKQCVVTGDPRDR